MKAHKIIYVVLVLSQIIGMVCLIFLYGVFAEFNGRKQELDIDNKYIDLSFEGVTIGEIKELIRTTCAEVEADLSYVYTMALTDLEYPVNIYSGYSNGEFMNAELIEENRNIISGHFRI